MTRGTDSILLRSIYKSLLQTGGLGASPQKFLVAESVAEGKLALQLPIAIATCSVVLPGVLLLQKRAS